MERIDRFFFFLSTLVDMIPYGHPYDENNMVHIRLSNGAIPEQFWIAKPSRNTFRVVKSEEGHDNYTIDINFTNAGELVNYCFDSKEYISGLLDRAEELQLCYGPHILISDEYN